MKEDLFGVVQLSHCTVLDGLCWLELIIITMPTAMIPRGDRCWDSACGLLKHELQRKNIYNGFIALMEFANG